YTGRAHPQDVTLFKSLGIAIEDVAVAAKVYAAAQGAGLGRLVEGEDIEGQALRRFLRVNQSNGRTVLEVQAGHFAMSMEPISLFARIADPTGVARRLRELAPSVAIDGPDNAWRKAVVTFGKLWKKKRLTLTHDPEYYAEPNWSTQMNGMRGYFSRF